MLLCPYPNEKVELTCCKLTLHRATTISDNSDGHSKKLWNQKLWFISFLKKKLPRLIDRAATTATYLIFCDIFFRIKFSSFCAICDDDFMVRFKSNFKENFNKNFETLNIAEIHNSICFIKSCFGVLVFCQDK